MVNIKKIIYTADTFYNSSFVGIKDIPLSCRFSIIVARRVYRQIGNKIFNIKDINTYKNLEKFMFQILEKFYRQSFPYLILLYFFSISKKLDKKYEYNLINEDISLDERI